MLTRFRFTLSRIFYWLADRIIPITDPDRRVSKKKGSHRGIRRIRKMIKGNSPEFSGAVSHEKTLGELALEDKIYKQQVELDKELGNLLK